MRTEYRDDWRQAEFWQRTTEKAHTLAAGGGQKSHASSDLAYTARRSRTPEGVRSRAKVWARRPGTAGDRAEARRPSSHLPETFHMNMRQNNPSPITAITAGGARRVLVRGARSRFRRRPVGRWRRCDVSIGSALS